MRDEVISYTFRKKLRLHICYNEYVKRFDKCERKEEEKNESDYVDV